MNTNELQVEIYKAAIKENIMTLFAAVVCVGVVAFSTGSLHSLWGLLILLNLNSNKKGA